MHRLWRQLDAVKALRPGADQAKKLAALSRELVRECSEAQRAMEREGARVHNQRSRLPTCTWRREDR